MVVTAMNGTSDNAALLYALIENVLPNVFDTTGVKTIKMTHTSSTLRLYLAIPLAEGYLAVN